VGAKRPGVDEFEFARRRLTAAAYGFESWSEFRNWRRRNPQEYRARSRLLMGQAQGEEDSILIDLFAEARRRRAAAGPRAAD
jgi:hypothetical protein